MKKEEYLNLEFHSPAIREKLKRRDVLKMLGGGIVILFSISDEEILEAQRGRGYPSDFNAYLRIGEEGRIACYTGKIEMGQGVITSLAQMAAEELDVTVDAIEMVMGDTDLCPWDMGTFGSMTTRFFGPALRAAAAEARAVLLELASEELKVPKDILSVENGTIFAKNDRGKRITYGRLARGKAIERHLSGKAVQQSVAEFTVMGESYLRRDSLEKVTGKAKFAGDIRRPGMQYAKVLRPPAHGTTMTRIDTSAAEKMRGATVVRDGDLVAVLAGDPETAARGLALVTADFDVPAPSVDNTTIFDYLLKSAPQANVAADDGNLEEGKRGSSELFEETFYNSYVAHAPMETHSAIAHVENNRVTAWIGTQRPFGLKEEIAGALGFSEDNVRVKTPFVGGGFGGKSPGRQAVEAARLSKLTGKPVQVVWSRAEEFFYDAFRPAAVVKIGSGIDNAGKITFWDYDVYFAGSRGSDQFYAVPNNRIRVYGEWGGSPVHPFAVGPWRAPANNTNTHARESQIDIMAVRAKMDPVEFRLNNLTDKRMRKVLETAVEKFGWTKTLPPGGEGRGVALGIDAGTYVAAIAEVTVDKSSGAIRVNRVVCVQDMGIVVNPEGATIQMEGCITMGLGYALTEEVRFRGGEILDRNFDTYEIPRFSWLPKIETHIIENNDLSPQGGGEPAVIVMGAVIANAVFDATGVRLYQLPMTRERVKAALARG